MPKIFIDNTYVDLMFGKLNQTHSISSRKRLVELFFFGGPTHRYEQKIKSVFDPNSTGLNSIGYSIEVDTIDPITRFLRLIFGNKCLFVTDDQFQQCLSFISEMNYTPDNWSIIPMDSLGAFIVFGNDTDALTIKLKLS